MDPTTELIGGIFARLRATTSITALVGTKIYDNPPTYPIPTSPYISMDGGDAISDDADCIDSYEVTLQIDVWSWGANEAHSSAQVRKIAHEIKKALHDYDLPMTTNACVSIRHDITRFMRSDDDQVNHAAVSITAIVEEP